MGYLGNKLQGKYHKDTFQTAVNMAWPAIVESFFIAFAGLVDSLMVSSLGSYAVAAVGLTTQPKLLGLAFFFALNVSISALVARRRGEQRQGAANETLVTALVFIILAAAAFSVGFVAFASPIIHLCGSTAETHNGAVTYFRIIMGGMIFNCIQMGINSAQRPRVGRLIGRDFPGSVLQFQCTSIIFSFSAIIAFQTEYHNTKSGYQRRKARIFHRSRTVPARRRVVLLFFVARMC